MSVVGLDFGSHAANIALWYENTDKAEVIADDLGFRTIPCAVAFRAGKLAVLHSPCCPCTIPGIALLLYFLAFLASCLP